MKKILILPLVLFFLVQGSMAQTPKWVEKVGLKSSSYQLLFLCFTAS